MWRRMREASSPQRAAELVKREREIESERERDRKGREWKMKSEAEGGRADGVEAKLDGGRK